MSWMSYWSSVQSFLVSWKEVLCHNYHFRYLVQISSQNRTWYKFSVNAVQISVYSLELDKKRTRSFILVLTATDIGENFYKYRETDRENYTNMNLVIRKYSSTFRNIKATLLVTF